MGHHRCCNKQKVKRGLWSPEEDERLLKHITCHGHGNWSSVPKLAGLQRCGKSCRLRWINYLRPDLKRGSFTPSEEQIIIDVHRILGNRWAQIAKHLPGRTDNEVKNFWNSCIKKKLISQGLDPKTHNLLSPHQRAALNITATATTNPRPVQLLNLHQHHSSSLLPCTFDDIHGMDHHHHHLRTLIGTSSSDLLQQQISNYANDDDIIVDNHHHHEAARLFRDGSTLDRHPAFELAAMGTAEKEKIMAVNIGDDVDHQYDQNDIAINGDDDHNYYYYYDDDQDQNMAGIDHNHHEVASRGDQQDRFDLAYMDPSLVHGAMYAADHFVPMDDFAWNF